MNFVAIPTVEEGYIYVNPKRIDSIEEFQQRAPMGEMCRVMVNGKYFETPFTARQTMDRIEDAERGSMLKPLTVDVPVSKT